MCANQANWPKQAESILNSLNWLYRLHYSNHDLPRPYSDDLPSSIDNPLRELSERVYRQCSNRRCYATERQKSRFVFTCKKCQVTIYCSERCLKEHQRHHQPLIRVFKFIFFSFLMIFVRKTLIG